MVNKPQQENENSQAGSEKSSFAAPSLSLPKGGGAIRGMGEKFSANPVTGTGAMNIPIAVSPGRAGFAPQLALSYDSGAGNGPFGFGWSLSLPSITRKTDRGLPQYRNSEESDVFLLSGAEDLVPVFRQDQDKQWLRDDNNHYVLDDRVWGDYHIRRYRPRIEGLFARIERWSSMSNPSDVHWRSISKDNILTLYGTGAKSRIFDPLNPERIFSWLMCETRDDKGNCIVYQYQEEDGLNLDLMQAHERNRGDREDERRTANRYIRSIQYGNQNTLLDSAGSRPHLLTQEVRTTVKWMFEIVFDYDEDHYEELADGQVKVAASAAWKNPSWQVRSDPFSTYRAGFEVRTYRRCRRVLMFHHFPALTSSPIGMEKKDYYVGLVRSTDFTYTDDKDPAALSSAIYSFIMAATQSSYQLDANHIYHKKSLPPLEFTYTEPIVQETVHELQSSSIENLPIGIDGSIYQWIDLDGEGLSGILTEQAGGWFYKRNLSPINSVDPGEKAHLEARFARVELVATNPAFTLARHTQFLDLAGDGRPDVVQFDSVTPGFYERTMDEGWEPFVAFRSLPNVDWNNPNLKFIDLNGDGHADILITEDNVFTWHRSLSEAGFGSAESIMQSWDEEVGPCIVFADGTQSIYLSDMSGDGLTDIVRIRNGEVCYWPNLGYGHFGAKVTMDNSPWFDHSDGFDQKRIRLADIDGSGTVDILYLSSHRIDIYFNQSGNSWAKSKPLTTFPHTDNLSSVQVLDLLGNGTACLVWGSPLAGDMARPMRYIDLMGHQKPHLLTNVMNNLGAETRIEYAPSTKFYLQDRLDVKPWITKLPFPVHCVEKVTAIDHWRKTQFTTTYSYHHGYFDGVEREFRGFGRVEQCDIEAYNTFAAGSIGSPYITNDQTLYQPPIKTITWFHTGASLDRQRILKQFEDEYFFNYFPEQINFAEKSLPEPDLAELELSAQEWREALRACKGMMLRQEVYELDVDALHDHQQDVPIRIFSAAMHNCHIQHLQPTGGNRHGVFLVTESEALTYNYELALPKPGAATNTLEPDPRIAHTLHLRNDEQGHPQQSIAVVYPRIRNHVDTRLLPQQLIQIHAVQREMHVAYSETRYTDDVILPHGEDLPAIHHRLRLPYEVLTYELTQLDDPTLSPDPTRRYFMLEHLRKHDLSDHYLLPESLPMIDRIKIKRWQYHERPVGDSPHMRLVEHARTLYFDDADGITQPISPPLALGQHGPRGIKYQDYKLALTTALLDAIFDDSSGHKLDMSTEGGHSARAKLNDPKISGYERLSPDEYWIRSGIVGFADNAARHFYLPKRYTDPFDNITTLEYDSRDLFIQSSSDARGNTTQIIGFDFRVLSPYEMRDVNNNLTELLFDVLGMVVAVAVKGKGAQGDNLPLLPADRFIFANPTHALISAFCNAETLNLTQARDWLGNATTRFVYHFGEQRDAIGKLIKLKHRPAGACGIQRERHVAQGGTQSKFQVALECSDGAGYVLMKKVQAEPEVENGELRWIVNGKTVLNNKGKPVKQYEPYFSDDFGCTEVDQIGVTPVMYYDSAGRLIRTEMPDGTFSRVEFSSWHVSTFDANDTVRNSAWFVERGAPLPSDLLPANADKRAAWLAAHHANTPTLTILDSLGRDVIVIAHNRAPDANGQWQDDYPTTFTKLDAEGKPLLIEDARGNLVMRYTVPASAGDDPTLKFCPAYDIAGNLLYQHSMDAGDRWMLMDAAGKPMLAWDFNQRQNGTQIVDEERLYFTEYDGLHRPVAQHLTIESGSPSVVEQVMVERFEYRDTKNADGTSNDQLAADQAANLLGQLARHYDPSGRVEIFRRDFKGNIEEVHRRLNNTPQKSLIDWQGIDPAAKLEPETETFRQITEYDALNRMTRHYNWHRAINNRVAVYEPAYNQRGVLVSERLTVRAIRTNNRFDDTQPDTRTTTAIRDIRYDAKGQKQYLVLGNGTITHYAYDEKTFRLRQLRTTRLETGQDDPAFPGFASNLMDGRVLQQLHYTYDPVGNITEIYDDAYEPVFFNNQKVEPRSRYVYDALYQLVEAEGRENITANSAPSPSEALPTVEKFPMTSQALRNYSQHYHYDQVGNILEMRHRAGNGNFTERWTRYYDYALDSNRLLHTWEGDDDWNSSNATQKTTYHYDTHGNMLNLANVAQAQYMRWDYRDMIGSLNLVGGGDAYYQYDASKQRSRKTLVRNNGSIVEDRIYFGGYELYRRYNGSTKPVEEIESHHLFEGEQRVLLVDDVIKSSKGDSAHPRPDGLTVKAQTLFRYQYSNHLGSACLELDDDADIISYEEYHPYGTSAYQAVMSEIEAPPKRYRYTGMERDEESGLSYHGARYYLLWLARWCSFDPSGLVSGINGYVAMNNSPTVFRDTNGRNAVPGIQPINPGGFPSGTPNIPLRLPWGGGPVGPPPAPFTPSPPPLVPPVAPVAPVGVGTLISGGALALGTGLLLLLVGMLGAGAYGASQIGEAQQSPEFQESVKYYAKASAKSPAITEHHKPASPTSPKESAEGDKLRKFLLGEKDAVLPGTKDTIPKAAPGETGTPKVAPGETGMPMSDPATTGTPDSVQLPNDGDPTNNPLELAPKETLDQFLERGGKIRIIIIKPQIHHIATNKDKYYAPIFEQMFENAGIRITGEENTVSIEGHVGPHGPNYNQVILDRLTKAVGTLTAGSKAYADAFKAALKDLKDEVARVGSALNDLVTRKH